MTAYLHRVTIACPEALLAEGNALALVLGESAHDVSTFREVSHVDAQGERYSVISTVTKPIFLTAAASPLVAPEHAPDADLALAGQAQARLQIYDGSQQITPDMIIAVNGPTAEEALAALGLTPLPAQAP